MKGVYPAYVTWENWELIQEQIRANHRVMRDRMKPRENAATGIALLTGLTRCGKCGRAMHVHYRGRCIMKVEIKPIWQSPSP